MCACNVPLGSFFECFRALFWTDSTCAPSLTIRSSVHCVVGMPLIIRKKKGDKKWYLQTIVTKYEKRFVQYIHVLLLYVYSTHTHTHTTHWTNGVNSMANLLEESFHDVWIIGKPFFNVSLLLLALQQILLNVNEGEKTTWPRLLQETPVIFYKPFF